MLMGKKKKKKKLSQSHRIRSVSHTANAQFCCSSKHNNNHGLNNYPEAKTISQYLIFRLAQSLSSHPSLQSKFVSNRRRIYE